MDLYDGDVENSCVLNTHAASFTQSKVCRKGLTMEGLNGGVKSRMW